MPAANTTTIYHRDGRERTVDVHEASRLVGAGAIGANKEWSLHKPPPAGWEKVIPQYRVTREVHPSPKPRFRLEPPFAHTANSDEWQYAERIYKRGEIIETKAWPHPSFIGLTYSAQRVLDFFNTRMKSRLTTSPWFGNSIRLDDGLTGNEIVSVAPPPMDLNPVA